MASQSPAVSNASSGNNPASASPAVTAAATGNAPQPSQTNPPTGTPEQEKPKPDGLFSALKDVLPVLAIYSYFAGWIYAYSFFKAFRVPVSSLDIPFQYFFMYSFSALANWNGIVLILVAAVCVVILKKHKLIMAVLACVLFIWIFAVAFVQATADADLQRYSSTNDRILLSFADTALSAEPPDLKENNKAERLRLLTETKDHLFVFYQPPPLAPDDDVPAALVYDIPKSNLVAVSRQVSDKRKLTLRETLWRIIHEQPAK